jgi:hypothetical protein
MVLETELARAARAREYCMFVYVDFYITDAMLQTTRESERESGSLEEQRRERKGS